jgi:hypothetical protein
MICWERLHECSERRRLACLLILKPKDEQDVCRREACAPSIWKVMLVKDRFYFVANSQWGAVSESGELAPIEALTLDHNFAELTLSRAGLTRR